MNSVRHSERGFDRIVNFSDAVVAIAITLLVLPGVDLIDEINTDEGGLWHVLGENSYRFWAFLVTFAVTMVFWMVHHRLFEMIGDYDYNLMWINAMWLAFVVILPFTSGLVNETGFADGVGLIYCGNMALLSLSLGFVSVYVRRHPELLIEGVSADAMHVMRSWVYAAFFAAVGIASVWLSYNAAWLMLLLIPLGRVLPR